jgi:hypothetical protein
MDLNQVFAALLGACFGSLGWLFVGLYINSRTARSAGRNAARAVYFELQLNQANVQLANDYGELLPLSRSTYEQLLPQLANLLTARDRSEVAAAYMAHIGYEQLRQSKNHPDDVRHQALAGILEAQQAAISSQDDRLYPSRTKTAHLGFPWSITRRFFRSTARRSMTRTSMILPRY